MLIAIAFPDPMHPYGFTAERYAWALVSGVGQFGNQLDRGIWEGADSLHRHLLSGRRCEFVSRHQRAFGRVTTCFGGRDVQLVDSRSLASFRRRLVYVGQILGKEGVN